MRWLYAQLLIAVSFAAASYQDVRERSVNDLVWVPAVAGIAYIVFWLVTSATSADIEFVVLKVALVGGVALAFTFLGGIGQADGIALAIVAADPFTLSPLEPLFAAAAVALTHIGYEYAVGNARGTVTISMEQFLREQRWIPKAVLSGGVRTEVSADVNVAREEVEATKMHEAQVEVKYGVPTVAYLGVGYVAYVVYLLVFNYGVFASLP